MVNQSPPPAPYIPDGVGVLGFIDLDIDTIGGEDGGGASIGGVKIEGGAKNIKNQIRDGLQQGLRKIIIDNWLDPQIRYIINNFTKMHIEIKRPDLGALLNEAITLEKIMKQV
ncbi:MAG: hypothetical protein LBI53_08230 [Candidatus Peribacteria bacterium]|jgi:hypothetical protein|nr:hypothetical protein [Candidatus Peribacteria bacterium]